MAAPVPDFIQRLLWDVDPSGIDLERHAPFVIERIMSRGTWEAMKWLRATYPRERLADFVRTEGARRLAARDLAYWALICDVDVSAGAGGGRPRWVR
ncbi:MAG TPA: hypothetical protein VGI39_44235 [Polyangiaceae bacterium]